MQRSRTDFFAPRMYLVGLVLCGVLGCYPVFTQPTHYIDSLERELSKKHPDTVRVSLLTSLASSYTFIDFQKSLGFAREAVELAEQINHNRLKMKANRELAVAYNLGGDFSSALMFENRALQLAIIEKDSTEIGLSYSNIGNYYHEMGAYDEAYYHLTRSYMLLKEGKVTHDDSVLMNIVIHNLGRVFKELGQYETALQHLDISQKRSAVLKDHEGNAYSLDEIGDVMIRMGKYDSALRYLTDAIQEIRHLLREDPQSLVKELQPKTLIKLARANMYKGEYEDAMKYYDSASQLYNVTNNQYGIAEAALGIGMLKLRQNVFEAAEKSIYKALDIARRINARVLEISCYGQLSELWEAKGDFKRSLDYYKRQQQLNDSLFNQEMQQKLFRDQVRFATASKDDQIEALTRLEELRKSEIRKQELIRNILVVVVALTVILLFTVYRSGQRRKRINKLLLQHQEEIKKRSVELEQLNQVKDKFFSIISHDLRAPINALAGILDLIDRGAVTKEELPEALRELRTRFVHTRTLMNNLLDWTLLQMDKISLRPTTINLKEMADQNIELMKAMHSKNIKFLNFIPPDACASADINTINLVVRNLISNALKFTNDGGEIRITAEEKDSEWAVAISDNGVGMKPEIQKILFDKINPYSSRGTANEKGTGLGLILCKEFIEKNNGQIWLESAEGQGSTFWFTLPKT
jgi:signal transduction histidine kinase